VKGKFYQQDRSRVGGEGGVFGGSKAWVGLGAGPETMKKNDRHVRSSIGDVGRLSGESKGHSPTMRGGRFQDN